MKKRRLPGGGKKRERLVEGKEREGLQERKEKKIAGEKGKICRVRGK